MTNEALYKRVRRRVPVLARRMVDTFLEEIPFYRRLPREQLDGEIRDICAENLRTFFATLIEDRLPTEAELAEPRSSAARRAQERVPLESVLTAYHVGGRLGWEELCREARPDETKALLAAADRVQRYVQVVSSAVADAYLEEQQSIYGEQRDVQRALVVALLSGDPADALAARLGVDLASSWMVLGLDLGRHDDEQAGGVTGAVAGRRKVRRVQVRLDEFCGEPVVGLLDADGGVVLLPQDRPTMRPLHDLVAALADAAGTPVRAGAAPAATTADLAAAGELAREIRRLAGQLDRPTGVYTLRDLLLEYQLTRPTPAVGELAAVLAPLETQPDLLLTLETYLAHDLDRRRAAAALHVHPNTLDYRIRRVVELTGMEIATARGLALLSAATTVRRVHRA